MAAHIAPGPLAAFSESLASIVDSVGASTLSVPGRHRRGLGSAVVWKAGVAVAAAHVFRRTPAAITLVGVDGKTVEATLAGIDSSTDIAVFRIAEDAAPAASFGDATAVRAGSLAVAVGRSPSGDLTASHGIVNKTSGPWETWLGGLVDRLIRLDGGVYEGLSGGPVADAHGAVIGIATSALSRSYGIVVPATTVTRVVDALLSKGRVARAFLGIGAQAVPLDELHGDDDEESAAAAVGLLVTNVVSGGPAQSAGVRIGDILVSVNGVAATSLQHLRQALADQVGQAVKVTLLRGGVSTELALTVGEWPTERQRC
jgi:S1-C subfamily serine protease